jgi:hypothetical protein
MPGPIAHATNTAICPHGGSIQDIPTTPRVMVMGGLPAAIMGDVYPIAGCVFVIAGAPHPCILCNWIVPAIRVTSMGRPLMLQTSVGLCAAPDQAPQGPPAVVVNQPRAIAI